MAKKYSNMTPKEKEAYHKWLEENDPSVLETRGGTLDPDYEDSTSRPNILNIAPAVQDKTRVSGLMEDIEVPAGEFADLDIIKEELIKKGFPAGLIDEIIEKLKTDPETMKAYKEQNTKIEEYIKNNPGAKERLSKGLNNEFEEDEDYPTNIPHDAMYGTGR